MNIHDIAPRTPRKTKKIVGRGGTRGKTSGRGTKGQNARAGHKKRPELRDIIKKLPKLRGYKFNAISEKPYAVNLSDLEQCFEKGDIVSFETLSTKKALNIALSKRKPIKILAKGTLTKALTIQGVPASEKAKEAILAQGGSVSE